MKKILIALLACLSATEANALKWFEMSTQKDGSKLFVDGDSVRKVNGKVRAWALMDQKKEVVFNSVKYQSIALLYEFDCAEERVRILSSTMYEKAMATGNANQEDVTGPWQYINPNLALYEIMTLLCRVKK